MEVNKAMLVKIISKNIKSANMNIYIKNIKLFFFKNWDSGVYMEETK